MINSSISRRALLQGLAATAAFAQSSNWKKHIGLELYTVRDLLAKDFEGTIAKVAEIGYTEVEPVGFGGLDPKGFRALLDRYKLTAPSTHTSATDGPGLDRELEGHQTMGFKYTEINSPRPATPTPRPAPSEENFKRLAAQMNSRGAIAKKFGMKLLYHNHAHEFDPIPGSSKTQYSIFLTETDPALVTFQLDIAWARIAGQDIHAMFKQYPGRFELWHVKDVADLDKLDKAAIPSKRRATFIPIGQGQIDYKPLFKAAKQAGLKYYVIEQDNAGDKGADSLAAARANYQGLVKVLG